MKYMKISLWIALFVGLLYFLRDNLSTEKEQAILTHIRVLKERVHVANPPLDDTFSTRMFAMYLEALDYRKRFLTKDEYDQLSAYRYRLDDDLREKNLDFFDLSVRMIERGHQRAEQYAQYWLDSLRRMDFTRDEYIEFDGEKLPWATDEGQLKDRWRKIIKYEMVMNLLDEIEELQKRDSSFKTQPIALASLPDSLFEEAAGHTRRTFERYFKRLKKMRRSDYFGDFANSFTMVMDPHSNYFSPKEKEDFDITMSGQLEGIGARLMEDKDYIKVVSIVPGGPAWKQKELEVNDLIIKVQQEGQEPVNIKGMRIDDVVRMIRGPKGTKVTLTVKKTSGEIKEITIVRDVVILDEGFARSLMLEDDKGRKIGYLLLPRFYTNYDNPKGHKASRDVQRELEKLQAAGAEAIIFDLRNNGGGFLKEVVEMAGLFIKKGPIVQVKSRRGAPYIYRDRDASVAYDGPLVLLVNVHSASASEILSAALQDYDRAIVVGSKATFGKGTVQRFYDLDRMEYNPKLKPLGQAKITTQKYYRIDGGSVQLKGVQPDIVLPDRFHFVKAGERDYDYPLPWDHIQPLSYEQDVFVVQPHRAELIKRSKERIDTSKIFQKVLEYAEWYRDSREQSRYPLHIDSLQVFLSRRKEQSNRFKKLFHPIEGWKIYNLTADTAYIQMDSSRIARNDDWIERSRKDAYLYEAFQIAKDMIELKGLAGRSYVAPPAEDK